MTKTNHMEIGEVKGVTYALRVHDLPNQHERLDRLGRRRNVHNLEQRIQVALVTADNKSR